MPFTHYPKLVDNIIFAWVQPAPPARPPFLNMRAFSELNRFDKAIEPGKSVVAYQDAQNFTRFYGSIACDQPLEVTFSFSNEEVDADGAWITDESIASLHYDAEALRQLYDPSKQGPTGKYFVTIFGRWLRVEIKNVGDRPTSRLRTFVRGSVF